MKPQQGGRLDWRPSDWPNNREDSETPDKRQARLEAVRLTQQERRDISIALCIHLSLHTLIIVYSKPSMTYTCLFPLIYVYSLR